MRNRLHQFAPLVIEAFQKTEYHLPRHGHTYYELVYIRAGHGQHWLNGHTLPYQAGSLFLLSPADEHRFLIAERTDFVFVKFTDTYLLASRSAPIRGAEAAPLLALMRYQLLKEVPLAFAEPTAHLLQRLLENLVAYQDYPDLSACDALYHQLVAVLCLVREALPGPAQSFLPPGQPDAAQLLAYVHQHIYQPAAVLSQQVATRFNLAPSYFSAYFKRLVGLSYRAYVNGYRTQLLQNRVAQGATLKQLAAEFGFTDESHAARYFRQQTRLGVRAYRAHAIHSDPAATLAAEG